ncbi:MAG: hypothetical protein GH148_03430 [Clostridia bacterium]|nr:hypothetical protein [Clostridia bacterium]
MDELEEIFKIIKLKYKESDLIIETDDYIYDNFEDLSNSKEGYVYRLKIAVKGKRGLEIYFKDNIYIKCSNKNDLGLVLKIKNILSDQEIIKSSFPYYFVKYNKIWYYIFIFLTPLSLSLIFKNFQNIVFIFFISAIFYVLLYGYFLRRNIKKILYSSIVFHKKTSDILKKESDLIEKKHYQKLRLILQIIGLFIPFLVLLISYFISINLR